MHTRLQWMTVALVASGLLAACGGGGDDAPAAPLTEVPDSAVTTSASYTAFANGLPADDSAEPLNVDRVTTPPTSETDDPAPLD